MPCGQCSTNTVTTIPQGIVHLKRIEALLDEPDSDLPELVREECRDLLAQIEREDRADPGQNQVGSRKLAAETDTTRRLQTMPGVGPIDRACDRGLRPGDGKL